MNIKLNKENHTYVLDDGTIIPSVTNIIKGMLDTPQFNRNHYIKRGTSIHNLVELRFTNPQEYREKILFLPSEEMTILSAIFEEFNNNFIKYDSIKTEKIFYHKIEGEDLVYAGTVDAIVDDVVVEFKMGLLHPTNHTMQASAYAKAHSLKKAIIIYYDGEYARTLSLSEDDIERSFNSFVQRYKRIIGSTDKDNEHLLVMFEDFEDLRNKCKAMEDEMKSIKEEIYEYTKEISDRFEIKKFMIYKTKDTERFTLKKEVKNKLLAEHLEYFDKAITSGSINIRTRK